MPDWKKEIKLSDLFKRDKAEQRASERVGDTDPASAPARAEPRAGAEQPSFWKREFKLSDLLKRGDGPAAPHAAESATEGAADSPEWFRADTASEATADMPEAAAGAPDASNAQPGEQPTAPVVPRVPDFSTPGAPAHQPFEPPPANVEAPATPQDAPAAPAPAEHPAEPVAAATPVGGSAEPDATTTAAPAPTASQADEETSVWKREVKASDLLKKMGWSGGGGPRAPQGKASDQRTPRPDSPASDDEEGASVWKRELKASDLFRRREKAPSVPGDAFSEEGAEPVSFWKKEISLTDLLRKPGAEAGTTAAPPEAPSKATEKAPKKKLGRPSLPKLGGGLSLGKGGGSRKSSSDSPIAVPLTRAVNLLPPDLAQQKKSKVGPAELGVGVAAVAVIAGIFILYTNASGDVDDATQSLEAVTQQQAELADQTAALQAEAGLGSIASPLLGEEGARASALTNALDSRTAWDRVLRRVTVVMPADTWLRGLGGTSTTSDLALSALGGAELVSTLTLTGFSMNRDGVAKLISRMETIPELATVQLLAATQTELNGETVVEFSITATLEDGADALSPAASTIGVTP